MDWGLLDKNAGENKFLREETVYRSTVCHSVIFSIIALFKKMQTLVHYIETFER